MSGGHFDYIQYRMESVADQIRREINRHDFPAEINARFEQAAQATELAAKMVQRVEWLRAMPSAMAHGSQTEWIADQIEAKWGRK